MWQKPVGIALLWAGLAALVHVAVGGSGIQSFLVAALGFVAFAAGLQLFADGFKRELLERLDKANGGGTA